MTEHCPWEILDTREVFTSRFVRVSVERVRLPDGREIDDFHRVGLGDYALVVPVLEDGRVLLLRQYKHGVRAAGLYPPGGGIGPGESPLAAVQRELLEETGHEAAAWHALGRFTCNANQGCGVAHFFLATGARPVATPESGDLEEMEPVILTRAALLAALAANEVNALGAAAAIGLALQHPAI
jgi:ADP-ribose pyrophosphatase